jgi:hypothetical protein
MSMELRAALRRLPFVPDAYALLRLVRGRNARFAADDSRNSGTGFRSRSDRDCGSGAPRCARVSLSAQNARHTMWGLCLDARG